MSITAGLSLLAYSFLDASNSGWGSTKIVSLLAVSVALIGIFVAIELRSKAPLVPFRIFRLRTLTGANVVGLLLGASLFSMFYFISLYMQQVLGYSAIHAGLSYLPLAVTIIVAAGLGGQLVTRFGFKPILATGMLSIAAGLLWFSQVSVGGGFLTDILGAVAAGGDRSRVRLRDLDDRGRLGSRPARAGPGERPDQHLAADRRRARARGAFDDRHLADGSRAGDRTLDAPERAHRGIPERLPRRRP